MIMRISVVVYAYDDSRTVSEVVNGILRHSEFPVLVLDDGSETPAGNTLYSWDVRAALEQKRVRVERSDQHQGKGRSLHLAALKLVGEGFTHMLTVDANGFHLPQEMTKLVEAGKARPLDLILGRKKPEVVAELGSSWKAKIAGFWVRYQTGLPIQDPRSSFRLYPLMGIQTLNFLSKHHEFEIEVLIRLQWEGVGVCEVEVENHPSITAKYISAKRKYLDGIRVSVLNTILALVSLFKTHRSPKEMSLALSMGVFVGCTPFYGFHTLMVMALAVLFRLNMVVMWIGTHVSTPIIAPLVVMVEIWIGRHWLHIGGPDLSDANGGHHHHHGEFSQWFAGSLVLGTSLSVLTFLVTYIAAWNVQNRKHVEPFGDSVPGGPVGRGILRLLARLKNRRAASRLLWLGVPYFYLVAVSARRGLAEYYKILRPAARWRERQSLIMRHLHGFAEVLLDRESGWLETGAPSESGAILSAHLGVPAAAGENVVAIDRVLENGRVELVPLLGRLIAVETDAIFKAATAGLPMTTAFCLRANSGYRIQKTPAKILQFSGGVSPELQCCEWAAAVIAECEALLIEHPEQWFNFFSIWSSLPRVDGLVGCPVEDLRGLGVLKPLPTLDP